MGGISLSGKKIGRRACRRPVRQSHTVPKDLSLVGFYDIEQAQYCFSALTTVAQPRYELGCESMHLLLEQLQGHPVPSGSLLLNSKLVIRDSTATPNYARYRV